MEVTATTTVGMAAHGVMSASAEDGEKDLLRVGVIGTGRRGKSLLGVLLGMGDIRIPALCDVEVAAAEKARSMVTEAGQPNPQLYTKDEKIYQALLERNDLDAVIIALLGIGTLRWLSMP